MIIEIRSDSDPGHVQRALQGLGLWTARFGDGNGRCMLKVAEHSRRIPLVEIHAVEGVQTVLSEPSKHPLIDAHSSVVVIGNAEIGGPEPILFAGPCSVESEAAIDEAAAVVAASGAKFLRGGAFKPRTSPYPFAGFGCDALGWMRTAADAHGLMVVTELMSAEHAEAVGRCADLIQIGSRNMQNYALLKAAGTLGMPVMLKRGMSASIGEWLLAGEHLLAAGATGVIFCERGVRHFSPETRFLLDVAAVTLLRDIYRLPVIVDPSHACGRRDMIQRLSLAGLAAGAAGVIVEMHPNACEALSDGPQQLNPGELLALGATLGLTRRCTLTKDSQHAG